MSVTVLCVCVCGGAALRSSPGTVGHQRCREGEVRRHVPQRRPGQGWLRERPGDQGGVPAVRPPSDGPGTHMVSLGGASVMALVWSSSVLIVVRKESLWNT